MTPDIALANYFRRKQFAMGQRYVKARVVSSLSARGFAPEGVEKVVEKWEADGLIREHPDHTISLTPAAYPHVAP
jgi:hypothetical protein